MTGPSRFRFVGRRRATQRQRVFVAGPDEHDDDGAVVPRLQETPSLAGELGVDECGDHRGGRDRVIPVRTRSKRTTAPGQPGVFDNAGDVPHTEQPAAVLPTATRVRGQHGPAAADRQALRRQILGVVTGPAEPLTGAIAR